VGGRGLNLDKGEARPWQESEAKKKSEDLRQQAIKKMQKKAEEGFCDYGCGEG